jgi:hypothetical protein
VASPFARGPEAGAPDGEPDGQVELRPRRVEGREQPRAERLPRDVGAFDQQSDQVAERGVRPGEAPLEVGDRQCAVVVEIEEGERTEVRVDVGERRGARDRARSRGVRERAVDAVDRRAVGDHVRAVRELRDLDPPEEGCRSVRRVRTEDAAEREPVERQAVQRQRVERQSVQR